MLYFQLSNYYLELILILLIKDLFWYSLLLNISFIWHVLILHWLFEMSLYFKWDYGCYLFSRLSLLTSLTGLYLFVMFLVRVQEEILYYFRLTKKEIGLFERSLHFIINTRVFICIFQIISYIISYFINNFTDYCLLIIRKKIKINDLFKSMDSFYWLFMFTFFISLILMWPWIYVIWLWFVCLKTYKLITDFLKQYKGK